MTHLLLALLFVPFLLGFGPGWLALPPNVQTQPAEPVEVRESLGVWVIYAYNCADEACVSASGVRAHVGMVAATSLPLGTVIYVEGVGRLVVADTGRLRANELDLFTERYDDAVQWGKRTRQVWSFSEGTKGEAN